MNTVISKVVNEFASELKETLHEFAIHLASEWKIDESRLEEAIASFKPKIRTKKTKKIKKKKDPNAPKKAQNAYLLFCNDAKPKLKEQGLEFGELNSTLGKNWKNISEEEKDKYTKLAKEDKVRFMDEMETYKSSSSSDDDSEAESIKNTKKDTKENTKKDTKENTKKDTKENTKKDTKKDLSKTVRSVQLSQKMREARSKSDGKKNNLL